MRPSLARRAWSAAWAAQFRNESLLLVGLIALVPLLPFLSSGGPSSVPLGIWVLGLVPGSILALQALAIVLVFRCNQFVNFGQVYIGSIGSAAFVLSANYGPVFRWVRSACPPCLGQQATHTQWSINYWVSGAVGVALSVFAAWLFYVIIVKRFENRPRLIVSVASIFAASATFAIVSLLKNLLTTVQQRERGILPAFAPPPVNWSFSIGAARFSASDELTVGCGVLAVVVLALCLRRSRLGLGIRTAADHPARAELVGINVNKIHSRVWLIVGFLVGLSTMLSAMGSGDGGLLQSVTVSQVMRVLLVAVVARFVSLPIAGIAAFVVGIITTATTWSFNGSSAPFDGALVFVVGGLLLLRARERSSRSDSLQASTLGANREVRPIPVELRRLPSVQRLTRSVWAVIGVTLLGLPWILSPGQTNLLAVFPIFGIVGLSLLVLTGWAGQISLGQFAFAAVGGYVVAVWHGPVLLAIIAAGCSGAVLAVLVGVPALRVRGTYLMISTLALAVSVSTLLVSPAYLGKYLPSELNRPSLFGLSLENQRTFYYVSLVLLALAGVAVLGLRRSRLGRVLIAARDNEQAAQSFGIGLVRTRLTAFAASGALAAIAGAAFAYHQHGLPLASFDENQSVDMFTMAVVGGLGSLSGPLIGAAYQASILVFSGSAFVKAFALGFGGFGLLLLAPGGLSQLAFGLRDAILRRVAKRNRILVPSLVADMRTERHDGRVPLSVALSSSGGRAFVPRRYLLENQWALPQDDAAGADTGDTGFRGLAEPSGREAAVT